jgi:DNA-binding Xre family transcriptional regulator
LTRLNSKIKLGYAYPMALMNKIDSFAKERGVPSANQFWKKTGLPRATAFRLFRDRDAYPDRKSVESICRAFQAQPGEFLSYTFSDVETSTEVE